ncbi:MAG: NAD(P)/FAD-dependent oxidoreductase [Anaerolineaceae bacterium]
MADYDVITIGAGHTGLIASTLLQKEGKKVLCLELNDYVGGIASNAHIFPGYTHNRGAWYLMFARLGWLWEALDLEKYGLELIYPSCPGVVIAGRGKGRKPFRMYANPEEQMKYIADEFGQDVAKQYIDFYTYLAPFGQAMDFALQNEPMSIGRMMDTMPTQAQEAMKKLFYGDVETLVNEFFPDKQKTAAIRSQIMGLGTDGFFGGVKTPGSALTVAYHSTTPETGYGGSPYRFPKGHIGAFSETIARSFQAKGGELRLNTEVVKILVRGGTAYGVKLADGSEITADRIVSSLDPYNNFVRLMESDQLDPFFRGQVESYKTRDTQEHIAQAHLAMKKIPTFCDEFKDLNEGDWRFSVWDFDPDNSEADWDAVKNGRIPKHCFATGYYMPSMMDPSLAPAGKQSMTICAQYAWPLGTPPEKFEETKKASLDMLIDSYTEYMPDFRDCVEDAELDTPPDWERMYHVTGGTWTHGMIKIENMFNCRPIIGMSDYRAPIKNMYLCGTSNHPGPGISGWAPLNCVKAIKADEKKQKK